MTHVQIFSTGGTIDKIYFDASSDYEVGEPQIGTLFREAGVTFEFSIVPLMRKDSLELTDADRATIAHAVASCPHTHVLITHGTDTMTQTATALEPVAREQKKTIVLTGAMAPARFQQSDAAFNVGCAVGALNTCSTGVYIAMNGQIFLSGTVQKNKHQKRFEPIP